MLIAEVICGLPAELLTSELFVLFNLKESVLCNVSYLLAIGPFIISFIVIFSLSLFCCFTQHVQQNLVKKNCMMKMMKNSLRCKSVLYFIFQNRTNPLDGKRYPNKLVRSKHSALTVTFRMAQLRAWHVQTVSALSNALLWSHRLLTTAMDCAPHEFGNDSKETSTVSYCSRFTLVKRVHLLVIFETVTPWGKKKETVVDDKLIKAELWESRRWCLLMIDRASWLSRRSDYIIHMAWR